MPKLKLLSKSEQIKFDSAPIFNAKQREKYFCFDGRVLQYVENIRKPINQVGFLVQVAYFKASGKFFTNENFRNADIKSACKVLELDQEEITEQLEEYSYKTRSTHKNYILQLHGWKKFSKIIKEKLFEELLLHAKKQVHPRTLVPIATNYLINCKSELPLYYVIAQIITDSYNLVENKLSTIVGNSIHAISKKFLYDLIWVDDKRKRSYKYSELANLKGFSYSTKISDIKNSIKYYGLLKQFHLEFESVHKKLNLSESATSYYYDWVTKSKLFQLKQFKNRNKAYLYLLGYLKHQYLRQTDLYGDILIKLIKNAFNTVDRKMDKHHASILKQQKQVIEKLAHCRINSTESFKKIINILDDKNKDGTTRDGEIRYIALSHLEENENKEIIELIENSNSSNILKYELTKSVGAKLHRKLEPIISELAFNKTETNSENMTAVSSYILSNCNPDKDDIKAYIKNQDFIPKNKRNSNNILVYKALMFKNIYNSIKAGELSLRHSYNYLSFDKYLIGKERWNKFSKVILESYGLKNFTEFSSNINKLEEILSDKYSEINDNYIKGRNKHLKFKKDRNFVISTPRTTSKTKKNKLTPVFAKDGIIPIPRVLKDINNATDFVKCFKHLSLKNSAKKPKEDTIFAGILSKGCNHGTIKMSNISKGINQDNLSNAINWFFSLENIQQANNTILDYINNLSLPDVYRLTEGYSHTSSDGQKFNVGVDSILANYSFKYFGQSQGISVYSFIDDRQVLFYDTVLSPGDREAAFVIDGLMANNVIKSHVHSTDTHGFTEVIFAVMHFLGISFAPRIKKIGVQQLYCINSKRDYKKKDYRIKPHKKINTKLIEDNWNEILRFVATIKSKTTTASQIFKRLNSYSKETTLYKALKEFGRIIKSIHILTFIDDVRLRQRVEKQLNRIELSNKFAKAVFFANGQEFRVGSLTEQMIIVACKSFIQNCIVLWNYLLLSQHLIKLEKEEVAPLLQIIKESSVISWKHINLHGEYDFTAANEPSGISGFNLNKIRRLKVVA